MSSTVTGIKSGGGYRYVLTCVETGYLSGNSEATFTAEYGGVLRMSTNNSPSVVSSIIVDGVTSTTNPEMPFITAAGYSSTQGRGIVFEIPFGSSAKVTHTDSLFYVLYKYVRYAES